MLFLNNAAFNIQKGKKYKHVCLQTESILKSDKNTHKNNKYNNKTKQIYK
jgi:hypothetical protein